MMTGLYAAERYPIIRCPRCCMAITSSRHERQGGDAGPHHVHDATRARRSTSAPLNGVKADKHSTGGVGDKTSAHSLPDGRRLQGVKIAKMSGRGLGHTGGTIDKLESFPGFNTGISRARRFIRKRQYSIGIAITGQTADLDPADKKALRPARRDRHRAEHPAYRQLHHVQRSWPPGADVIVLDVKCGDGAFMKTVDEAKRACPRPDAHRQARRTQVRRCHHRYGPAPRLCRRQLRRGQGSHFRPQGRD